MCGADIGSCKAKSNATKSFRIAEAPPVLTLHLKRFMTTYNSYNGRAKANKFNGKVEFDEFLDIGPYMIQGNVSCPFTALLAESSQQSICTFGTCASCCRTR